MSEEIIDDYMNLCAALYQAAGCRNLPERFLEVLDLAMSGEPFAHLIDGLLPISEEEEGAFGPVYCSRCQRQGADQ